MKTATFDYTDMDEVDSSFIETVFYNKNSRELAILMLNGSTHFYGSVPYTVYEDLVDEPSAGYVYNRSVRDTYTNLAGGPVQNVSFVRIYEGVYRTFNVAGVSVVTGTYKAKTAGEAAKMFVNDFGDVSVTEVTKVD